MHNFPSYMSIWIGGYNYTSASLNSNKTYTDWKALLQLKSVK